MSRDPRREECTTCTAVAPDAVLTVRTCAATSPPYDPGLVRKSTAARGKPRGERLAECLKAET